MTLELAMHDALMLEHVESYVVLQTGLVSELFRKHPSFLSPQNLLWQPDAGTIEAHGDTWNFRVHGAGVVFLAEAAAKTVDIPNGICSPQFFDPWRLDTYFISLGLMCDSATCEGKLRLLAQKGLILELERDTFCLLPHPSSPER